MSANAIFALVAVGVFLLLCVVSWYLVQLLRQMRLTALATTTLGFVRDPLWLTVLAIAAAIFVLQAIAIGLCARYVPAVGESDGR